MKITFALCALLLAGGLTLMAADKADKPKAKFDPEAAFKKMDKNSDSKLSKEEFLGKREGEAKTKGETQFTAKDKDKDGSLTLEEFKAGGGKKAPK